MEIIIIPDSHGTERWKKVKDLIDSVDKIVFLGDYFDSWTKGGPAQISNFKQIMKFKFKNNDKVITLWGNHEISYYLGERCSGYQHNFAFDIEEVLRRYAPLLDVVHIQDNWIFVHGGVSKEWLKVCGIDSDPFRINQLFKERPNFFLWVGPNSFGDNRTEGPLWIRPGALKETALDDYNFVCGHTETRSENMPLEIEHKNNGKILLIDNPKHDCIIKLDTITGKYEKI